MMRMSKSQRMETMEFLAKPPTGKHRQNRKQTGLRGISRSKIATTGSSTGPQDVFKAILGQTIMRVMPPAMYAIYELNNVELLFVVH
jgi:hypothetical protein